MRTSSETAAFPISHPEKVLYPLGNISKSQLLEYYTKVGVRMLEEIRGRPLVLVRCPEGRDKECFFQKHPDKSLTKDMPYIDIREKRSSERYVYADRVEDIYQLAQMDVLEVHVWGSRVKNVELADRIIFDLDPDPGVEFSRVIKAAQLLRELFRSINLESFPRTTGGKGLHVVVPINPAHSWEEVLSFSKTITENLAFQFPGEFVSISTKAKRKGKIYIDYLRNRRGSTSVANYSTRAHPKPTVAMPLKWSEVSNRLHPEAFTIETVPARVRRRDDPWEEISSIKQKLPAFLIH